MANVNGIHGSTGPGAVEPARAAGRSVAAAKPHQAGDTVEISLAARLAMKVREIPDVRTELVERVKGQIEDGTYESPERIDATVERLLDELGGRL